MEYLSGEFLKESNVKLFCTLLDHSVIYYAASTFCEAQALE